MNLDGRPGTRASCHKVEAVCCALFFGARAKPTPKAPGPHLRQFLFLALAVDGSARKVQDRPGVFCHVPCLRDGLFFCTLRGYGWPRPKKRCTAPGRGFIFAGGILANPALVVFSGLVPRGVPPRPHARPGGPRLTPAFAQKLGRISSFIHRRRHKPKGTFAGYAFACSLHNLGRTQRRQFAIDGRVVVYSWRCSR